MSVTPKSQRTAPTHTLHAAGMQIGHVRGVQDLPVTLIGTRELVDEDTVHVHDVIVDAVVRVLPKVDPHQVVLAWRPSGRTVDVWVPMVGPMAKSGRRVKLATFGVRSVAR